MTYQVEKHPQIKKHVATIHTSGELTLIERKLVNVLLLNAFDNLQTYRNHTIPVHLLSELVGWQVSQNFRELKKALSKLSSTQIQFNLLADGKEEWETSSFIASAKIANGIVTYDYSFVMSEKMANPEVYATINMAVQNQFSGSYALTLYENCKRFHKVGSTGFIEVGLWRKLLGATAPMYDEFRHLSNHVIKKAVAEINQVSDIFITPEYQRHVRKVTHIKFLVADNPQSTIYSANNTDRSSELRALPTYRRLIDHGIGDKLAVTWLAQESTERIDELIDYTEKRDHLKLIRGQSTAGYLRTLVETKAVATATNYQKKKQATVVEANLAAVQEASAQAVSDDQEKQFKASVKALTVEERRTWAARYFDAEGAGREKLFTPETGTFSKGEPNIHFTSWLRQHLKK